MQQGRTSWQGEWAFFEGEPPLLMVDLLGNVYSIQSKADVLAPKAPFPHPHARSETLALWQKLTQAV